MNNLDRYVTTPPSPQNAVDIFQGAWSTRFTAPFEHVVAGTVPLFSDVRVPWAAERFNGFEGKSVLELGPLEGAQSYLLEKLGASSILAIEANTSAYLKCLIVKELFQLQRVHFLCGDFIPYLRTSNELFDVVFASGVFYHMRRPAELIHLASRVSEKLFLWTHYYDSALITAIPQLQGRFQGQGSADYAGFTHTLYRQEYQAFLQWDGFCGGSAEYSYWMSRADILACLNYFGYDDIRIGFEDPTHHGGPCFAIAAMRSRPSTEARPTFSSPLEYRIDPALLTQEVPVQTPPQAVTASRDTTEKHLSDKQQAYISHLEQTIKEKDRHIAALEDLLQRISNSRLMRLINFIRRSK